MRLSTLEWAFFACLALAALTACAPTRDMDWGRLAVEVGERSR